MTRSAISGYFRDSDMRKESRCVEMEGALVAERKRDSSRSVKQKWISAFLTTRREKIDSSEYNWNAHIALAHLVSYLQLGQSFYSRKDIFQTQHHPEKCLVTEIAGARSTE